MNLVHHLPNVIVPTNISSHSMHNQVMVAVFVHIVNPLEFEQPKSNQEVTDSQFYIPDELLQYLNTERKIITLSR